MQWESCRGTHRWIEHVGQLALERRVYALAHRFTDERPRRSELGCTSGARRGREYRETKSVVALQSAMRLLHAHPNRCHRCWKRYGNKRWLAMSPPGSGILDEGELWELLLDAGEQKAL